MSEIQSKLEAAFKDTSGKLSDLNNKLNEVAYLEQEITELSSNLKLSSNGLRKLTKDHADYLQKVDRLNSALEEIAKSLIEIKPKELEKRLSEIEQSFIEVETKIVKSELEIKSSINKLSWLILFVIVVAISAYVVHLNPANIISLFL